MINNVVLMGRLTAEPEVKTTSGGVSYCRFSLAVERPYKSGDEKKTDFFNCVAWRQTAEFIERYFKKGQMLALVGSLRTGSYTNKDGAAVNTVDINVDSVSFTGDRQAQTGSTPAQTSGRHAQTGSRSGIDISDAAAAPDDDLPF